MQTPATIHKLSTATKIVNGKTEKFTTVKTSLAKAPRASSKLVEGAATTQMIGQLVGAAGDVFELSSNIRNSLQAEKHGLGVKAYAGKAKELTDQVDELLTRRNQALFRQQTSSGNDLAVVNAEGAVLKDVRDLAVLQSVQYRSGIRKLHTFQNAAYVLNIAKNAAGAAGNMLNLESTHNQQPKLAGGASVLTTVAGAIIVATPVLGRVSGNLAGLVDRRIASQGFTRRQRDQTDELVRDRHLLSDVLHKNTMPESDMAAFRNNIYEQEERLFIAQKDNLHRENRLARKTTIENVVFGTIVGSSRITQGTLGMVGAWRYYNQSWMNSRCTAAGATAYAAGTSFNILETARVRADAELSAHKLKNQHLLPSQIVQNRIETLASMQKSLENMPGAVATKQASLDLAH